jgi:all-trans-retinol 13,14-reductase
VCVAEKNHQLGGNLQTFTRDGHTFDTGLHYLGSLDEGQTLRRFFDYLGLTGKLNLKKLDEDGYDHLSFGTENREYKHAQGYPAFEESLIRQFPAEKPGIKEYIGIIRDIIRSIPLYDLDNASEYNLMPEQLKRCAMQVIRSVTKDFRLQSVLAGANSLYHGATQRTPLYVHACIRNSFINSAWRPIDGSDQIANELGASILLQGGTLLTDTEITGFRHSQNELEAAILSDGRELSARKFIAAIHPAAAMKLIVPERIRSTYRRRIESLENTPGFFTVYLVMKKNSFHYLNFNHFHYRSDDYFHDNIPSDSWPHTWLLYTPAHSTSVVFSETASVLSFMKHDDLKKWDGIHPEERGEEYRKFKEERAEKLLIAVEGKFPGFRAKIQKYFISTPLTFKDCTGTQEGSAYGILKDCKDPAWSIISHRTKIPNLYFTGQNLNIHGVLGTTISAMITCSEFIGFRKLLDKIIHV